MIDHTVIASGTGELANDELQSWRGELRVDPTREVAELLEVQYYFTPHNVAASVNLALNVALSSEFVAALTGGGSSNTFTFETQYFARAGYQAETLLIPTISLVALPWAVNLHGYLHGRYIWLVGANQADAAVGISADIWYRRVSVPTAVAQRMNRLR